MTVQVDSILVGLRNPVADIPQRYETIKRAFGDCNSGVMVSPLTNAQRKA